jgi:hypothetical protein
MSQARNLYNALLENGELKALYSSMKGSWEKDEKSFTRQYDENQALINDDSLIDLDELDEFTGEF